MIKRNKDKKTSYFDTYNLSMDEISSLVSSINIIINNFRHNDEVSGNNINNISSTDIFNTWLFYNSKWQNMNFEFLMEVFDYIDTIKDEDGIILS